MWLSWSHLNTSPLISFAKSALKPYANGFIQYIHPNCEREIRYLKNDRKREGERAATHPWLHLGSRWEVTNVCQK